MNKTFAVLAALLFCAAGAEAETAARSVLTGVYTEAQAARGLTLFVNNCAKCHELGLTSSATIPPLGGEDFMSDFTGSSVADLETRVQNTMPADNPGKLSAAEVTDLTAFILQNNHIPPGTAELSADPAVRAQLRIEAPGKN
jgi:cytochrome c553